MAALKVGNHTHELDDIDWFVSQINCLCQWQFGKCILITLNWLHGVVVCQIGHPEEPHSLSLVEIRLFACAVHKKWGYTTISARCDVE
jgi:hypothetical protein